MSLMTVIGAGNGGKATAADLALAGHRVRLAELPEFAGALDPLRASLTLHAEGEVAGTARLEQVTEDVVGAVDGAEIVFVCTQAAAHERLADLLAPVLSADSLVVLNPGSTGGALTFARAFRQAGRSDWPTLAELATLTYGCRGAGDRVSVYLKVRRVVYGTLPAAAVDNVGPRLESLFPGLLREASVLEAGLNNANPVIHTPIALLNAARIEQQGTAMRFYADGVTPAVASLIAALDEERMALLRALGYPAQPDPLTSVQQGYATSDDYLDCYAAGPVFGAITAPPSLDYRFLHEDVGIGLVMYRSLGRLLGVPTPVSDGMIALASVVAGHDYLAQPARSAETLGLAGLTTQEIRAFVQTGRPAA